MNKYKKALLLLKHGSLDRILSKLSRMPGVRNILLPLPTTIMIEPNNSCNLRCPTCPTGSGKMNRPRRIMSFEEFKKIIDQVKNYLKHIILWNYGEPFLNKELLNMINYAVRRGIRVVTSTNGEFFKSEEFCLEVVRSGLQHIIICLDGADQETIGKYRKGSNFNEIVDSIQFLVSAKKMLNSDTPIIELQFIVMKHNEHQIPYIKRLATKLGVDIFCEKTMGIDYNDEHFQKMAKEFLPNDLSLSRFFLKADGTYALKGEISNHCSWVFENTVINSDGTVVPCCYDSYSKYIMGNVFEESLKNIWRGRKYKRFRRRIKKDRKGIAICNICSEGRYAIDKRSNLS